jgi:GDP-L-fucose synthase
MYRKIMVTGGTSVLGGSLRQLIDRNEYPGREFLFPSSKDCNLLDADETLQYVEQEKPDAILHFAAISGGSQFHVDHRASILRDNILMNFNVAEAARLSGVRKAAMVLTTILYAAGAPFPLKEEYLHDGYPPESHYTYAFAKRLIDPMIRAYREQYGLNMIGLIPNVIVGERSNFSPAASPVAPALIRRFVENKDGSEPLVVWGDGSPCRELTYGEDVARAFMWCLDHYSENQCLHVGCTEEISIREIAFLIARCLGIAPERIVFNGAPSKGPGRIPTDNGKFVSLSNFKYTPTSETIRKVTTYFMENYPDPVKLRL